jgi:hypothetical protein
MQDKLQATLNDLGSAERGLVEDQYLNDLKRWAQIFDQVSARPDVLATFGEGQQNEFKGLIADMENVLAHIANLNMVERPTALHEARDRVDSFKNGSYTRLLDFKNRVQGVELDTLDLEAMKKVVEDAKIQAEDFKKSFASSLRKQARGSTKTLERHFNEKIRALKDGQLTSPEVWQGKRNFWLWVLVGGATGLSLAYVWLMISWPDFPNYAIQIAVAKLVLLGLAYLQYNFSTRNYHISSDQIAHYEQQEVIARTLTDFTATATEDAVLKESILTNATKTLFAEIKTGHLKDRGKDGSVVENIINQIPKAE